jgi:hypothetical protein
MTTKHTPGPWEIDGEYVQQVGQTGLAICDVMNMDVGGDKGWHSGPVTQANKHLIAAAPDLLEALEDLKSELVLSNVDQDYVESHFRPCLNKAAAAIAKATGDRLGQLAAEAAIAKARGSQ